MLHVTPAALAHLRQMLTGSKMPPGAIIRLAWAGQQRTDMKFATPEDDDHLVADERGPVLAIQASLARALDGLTFDYSLEPRRGATEAGFIMRQPTDADQDT